MIMLFLNISFRCFSIYDPGVTGLYTHLTRFLMKKKKIIESRNTTSICITVLTCAPLGLIGWIRFVVITIPTLSHKHHKQPLSAYKSQMYLFHFITIIIIILTISCNNVYVHNFNFVREVLKNWFVYHTDIIA